MYGQCPSISYLRAPINLSNSLAICVCLCVCVSWVCDSRALHPHTHHMRSEVCADCVSARASRSSLSRGGVRNGIYNPLLRAVDVYSICKAIQQQAGQDAILIRSIRNIVLISREMRSSRGLRSIASSSYGCAELISPSLSARLMMV